MKTETNSDAGSGCPAATCSALRAYRVTHPSMNGLAGIYVAESPGKARYKALLQAHDAGFRFVTMPSLTVHRAPEFDGIRGTIPYGEGCDEGYARKLLKQNAELTHPDPKP